MSVIDTCGRTINYLRLSITDRCNLRCTYCMPANGIHKRSHSDVLSYEELHRIVQGAVDIGVEKVRITGGEPLVRKGVVGFLAGVHRISGVKKLVLTTNGLLLEEMAEDLKLAGVESINISLDSMQPEVFSRITRLGDVGKVMAGIKAAERVGFRYLKINMVVMRGINDHEVLDFAALTLDKPINVRFIEYMPTTREDNWQSLMIGGDELLARLSRRFSLQRVVNDRLDGPAVNYQIKGAAGKIGFITPISRHFCHQCNRIRVTSSGTVKSCLFEEGTMNLKPYLATGDVIGLREALRRAAWRKPVHHSFLAAGEADIARFSMSQIGG